MEELTPAIYHLPPTAVVRVEGEDAAQFLQGQATQDLASLEIGHSTYTLFLTAKGGVVADAHILRTDEETFLLYSAGIPAEQLINHLANYIIADDVELDDRTSRWEVVVLVATEAPHAPASGYHLPGQRLPGVHTEVLVPAKEAEEYLEKITNDRPILSPAELEALRVRSGRGLVGRDVHPTDLPQEVGLEGALSFQKGCFTGQEVVNRLRTRGQVRRKLLAVRLPHPLEPTDDPRKIQQNGKIVGELRTVAGNHGLAMVKTAALTDGAPWQLPEGVTISPVAAP